MYNRKKMFLKKYSCIILYLVITKRVKVANELYSKSDAQLLEDGRNYVTKITGNTYFSTPTPPLLDITTALGEFEDLISSAKGGDTEQVSLKNAKREQVMNLLSTL